MLLHDDLVQGQGITAWGNTSYLEAVHDWSDRMGISPYECARRFGAVSVSVSDGDSDWRVRFHPVLGFTKLPIRQLGRQCLNAQA